MVRLGLMAAIHLDAYCEVVLGMVMLVSCVLPDVSQIRRRSGSSSSVSDAPEI
jgi:hypothetical protein